MNNFIKTIKLGHLPKIGNVFAKVTFYSGKLSITGVEGPKSNGNCAGSCGQIEMHMDNDYLSSLSGGLPLADLQRFVAVWREWHLNDMQAGTPKQTAVVKDWQATGAKYDYTDACQHLKSIGLLSDNGYTYGSAWLRVEVPENVLQWLASLPETDVTPAWV